MKAKAEVNPRRVEFESDGLVDSLTHALAPARFQEILQSELSKADRAHLKIAVISAKNKSFEISSHDSEKNRTKEVEVELKCFAEIVSSLLRSGDEIGRISEDGFWILIHGDRQAAERAIGRFTELIHQADWHLNICESESGESIKNLLRRVDLIHFAK